MQCLSVSEQVFAGSLQNCGTGSRSVFFRGIDLLGAVQSQPIELLLENYSHVVELFKP